MSHKNMRHLPEGATVQQFQPDTNNIIAFAPRRERLSIERAQPLPPLPRNLSLDFWAQVIVIEAEGLDQQGQYSVSAVRQRLVKAIEEAVTSERSDACEQLKALGIPTFVELVLANRDDFSSVTVRKARSLS